MQDFEMLRCVLHYKGTLTSYEMEELNKLPMTAGTRCNQVYKLLYYLDQKSDGPFKLIETLQEMALESNWLAEIADTFIKEYCKCFDECLVYASQFLLLKVMMVII